MDPKKTCKLCKRSTNIYLKFSGYVQIMLVNLSSGKRCIYIINMSLGSSDDFLSRSKVFLLSEFFSFSTVVAQVLPPGAGKVQPSKSTMQRQLGMGNEAFPQKST